MNTENTLHLTFVILYTYIIPYFLNVVNSETIPMGGIWVNVYRGKMSYPQVSEKDFLYYIFFGVSIINTKRGGWGTTP